MGLLHIASAVGPAAVACLSYAEDRLVALESWNLVSSALEYTYSSLVSSLESWNIVF